jgi:nitrate reductase beta subunit
MSSFQMGMALPLAQCVGCVVCLACPKRLTCTLPNIMSRGLTIPQYMIASNKPSITVSIQMNASKSYIGKWTQQRRVTYLDYP